MKKIVFFLAFFTACILTAQNEPSAQLSRLYSLGTHPTRVNFVLPQNNPKQLRNKIVYTLDSLIYIVDWQGKGTFVQDENPILPVTDTTSLASDNDLLQLRNELARKLRTDSLEANRVIGNLIETNGDNDVVLEPRSGTTLGVTKYRYGNNSIPVFDGASDVTQPFVRHSQNGHQFVGKVLTSRRADDSNEVVQKIQLDETQARLTERVDSTIRISDSARISGDVVVFYVFGDFQEKRTWRHEHKAKLDRARPNDLSRPYPTILSARNAAAKMIVTKKIYEAKIVVLQSHQKERWIHNNFKNEVITVYEVLDDNDNPTGVFAQDTFVDMIVTKGGNAAFNPISSDSTSLMLFYPNITYYFERFTGIDYLKEDLNTHYLRGVEGVGLKQRIEGFGEFSIFHASNLLTWRDAAEMKGGEYFECQSFSFKRTPLNGFAPYCIPVRRDCHIKINKLYVNAQGMAFAITGTSNANGGVKIEIGELFVDSVRQSSSVVGYEMPIIQLYDQNNGITSIKVNKTHMIGAITPLVYMHYSINNSNIELQFNQINQSFLRDTNSLTPLFNIYANSYNLIKNSTIKIQINNLNTNQPVLNFRNTRFSNSSLVLDVQNLRMTAITTTTPKSAFYLGSQIAFDTSCLKINVENSYSNAGTMFDFSGNTNSVIAGRYSTTSFPAINVTGDNSKVMLSGLFSTNQANSINGTGTITVLPSASANVGVGAGVTLNGTLSVNPNFRF